MLRCGAILDIRLVHLTNAVAKDLDGQGRLMRRHRSIFAGWVTEFAHRSRRIGVSIYRR